jgi:hypothetical protein
MGVWVHIAARVACVGLYRLGLIHPYVAHADKDELVARR